MIAPFLLALALGPALQSDVVVFVLDDIAREDLALYGGPAPTPALDALARQGVRFTRCYANATCSPTRRSLLTGHWWVRESGEVCAAPGPLTPPLAEEFLPEALPHVSGIVGKWHVGSDPLGGPWQRAPIHQGFDFWMAGTAANVVNCGGTTYTDWVRVNAGACFHESRPVTAYEPLAVRDAFNAGWQIARSPKFAYVAPALAHSPFHRPPSPPLPAGYPATTTLRQQFEAMIVAGDVVLGQMLARIDLARTLVIVVGDNGTPDPVAPGTGRAKTTTFERGVRVPLVIAGAGVVNPGRTSDELVHVVDLWRTAIEAGGGRAPGGSPYPIVSSSLMPILADAPHLAPHDYVLVGSGWGDFGGDVASVSASGTKLRELDANGDELPDRQEFYDLNLDPRERTNLVGDPTRAAEIAAHRAFIAGALP